MLAAAAITVLPAASAWHPQPAGWGFECVHTDRIDLPKHPQAPMRRMDRTASCCWLSAVVPAVPRPAPRLGCHRPQSHGHRPRTQSLGGPSISIITPIARLRDARPTARTAAPRRRAGRAETGSNCRHRERHGAHHRHRIRCLRAAGDQPAGAVEELGHHHQSETAVLSARGGTSSTRAIRGAQRGFKEGGADRAHHLLGSRIRPTVTWVKSQRSSSHIAPRRCAG